MDIGEDIRLSMENIGTREQGLEPRLPDSESGVLPLDDSRILSVGATFRESHPTIR